MTAVSDPVTIIIWEIMLLVEGGTNESTECVILRRGASAESYHEEPSLITIISINSILLPS